MINMPPHKPGGYKGWNITSATSPLTKADPGNGRRHYVTGISGSGSAAATVTVESPSGTILWRQTFTAAFVFDVLFPVPLEGADSEAVLLAASAGTVALNMSGYETRQPA